MMNLVVTLCKAQETDYAKKFWKWQQLSDSGDLKILAVTMMKYLHMADRILALTMMKYLHVVNRILALTTMKYLHVADRILALTTMKYLHRVDRTSPWAWHWTYNNSFGTASPRLSEIQND